MLVRRRGFTLVELMVAVTIISIVAALAIFGVRRYRQSARLGEATNMLQSMRAGEESYKQRVGAYGGCQDTAPDPDHSGAAITAASFYPRALGALDERKAAWDAAGNSDLEACFRTMGFHSGGSVSFSYAASAGPGGVDMTEPTAPAFSTPLPTKPGGQGETWYVLVAAGDSDNDGVVARIRSTSRSGDVHVEQDNE